MTPTPETTYAVDQHREKSVSLTPPPEGKVVDPSDHHYLDSYVRPVRHLRETLAGILDVDANPDRSPEQALAELRAALDTFTAETEHWLGSPEIEWPI